MADSIGGLYHNERLSSWRQVGDLDADRFIQAQFQSQEQKAFLQSWLSELTNNEDLNTLPIAYAGEPVISSANRLPGWADVKLMHAGASFFARHAELIMNMLGLLSLPYCYAAANGAMVLYLSERIKADTGKRLFETADFVWDVMAPNAFEPGGAGFAACLKIRLMHAAARFYTLKSGKWNSDSGVPVNQEDMAGTNLSFSLIVIRGLRKFGLTVPYPEQQAFMHLWNVTGSLLGLHNSLLPANGKQAFNLEETIRMRQFRPSEQGRALTRALTQYFSTSVTGGPFSAGEVVQVMRYLLGSEAADIIGLAPGTLPVGQVRLLQAVNYAGTFKPKTDTQIAYRGELYKFKKNKPASASA